MSSQTQTQGTNETREVLLSAAEASRLKHEESGKVGMYEGGMAAMATAIPSSMAFFYVYKNNPKFLSRTNVSSRTALFVTPPLFAFFLASELGVIGMADKKLAEKETTVKTVMWAENVTDSLEKAAKATGNDVDTSKEKKTDLGRRRTQISELYKMSVGRNLRIIPDPAQRGSSSAGTVGYSLPLRHQMANFIADNPFKVLVGVGMPVVGYVFTSQASKKHLQFQQMIMHTRVIGQFTVVVFLLSLMGFKDYMDRNGRFITEYEAASEVTAIEMTREKLRERLKKRKTPMALAEGKISTIEENKNFIGEDGRPLTVQEIMESREKYIHIVGHSE
uniref:HIG1 domain-containing protein n=1 Tax=Corethron hystrix TaxID=216773 RepID=A0A7S1FL74_9STRA|mmetsp:Transcript_10453/g.23103  ORF Transcript_10453/g.23103 Transcript_10453/m.23103 type:complete len:334 (+) Transcript_10453:74-1075(+)